MYSGYFSDIFESDDIRQEVVRGAIKGVILRRAKPAQSDTFAPHVAAVASFSPVLQQEKLI